MSLERPGPVADGVEAAAVQVVLDPADGVRIVGAEETLPGGLEHALADGGGDHVGQEERG